MKKTWNKNTRFNKFIAFCLALLLAVVPLLTYVGNEEGAKAATTGVGTGYFTYKPDENAADVTLEKQSDAASEDTYYLTFTGDASAENITFDYFTDNLSFAVQPELLTTTWHPFEYTGLTNPAAGFEGYDLAYVKVQSGATMNKYEKSVTSDCTLSESRLTGDLATAYPDGVAVYIKPKVKSGMNMDLTILDVSRLDAKMGYTLIGVYKFQKSTLAVPKWQGVIGDSGAEDVVDSNKAYKSASLNVTSYSNCAGVIKYAYIQSSTVPDLSAVSAAAWTSTVPSLGSAVLSSDGTYYGCVGYFAQDAAGTEKLAAYELTATPVKLDVTPPDINNLNVEYGTAGAWTTVTADDIDDIGTFTAATSDSLRISFTIPETGITPTVKLGAVEVTGGTATPNADNTSTDYVYVVSSSNIPSGSGDKITVTAADAAGNDVSSIYKIGGTEITFTKMTACFEVSSAKIAGSVTGNVADLPTSGNITYIGTDWVVVNGTPSIRITMKSDQATTGVTSSGTVGTQYAYQAYYTDSVKTGIQGTYSYSRPYYQTTISQSLGATSQKFENITLVYRKLGEAGNTTVTYGTIIYDVDKPEISVAELQYSTDGGSTWTAVTTGIQGTDADAYYYINPKETTKYRYYVAASDATSGLADSPIKCSPSYDFTYDTAIGGYVHEITDADLAANISAAAPVCVTAKDKADNSSEEKYLPRVIKQEGTTTVTPILKKADGTTVELTDTTNSYITNEPLTLEVTVTSGVKINTVELTARVNGAASAALLAASDTGMPTSMNDEKLYKRTLTYQIPADTNINNLIRNGVISVTTDDQSYDTTKALKDILYDISAPVITDKQGNAFSTLAGLGWQKEYTLPYKIVSGSTSYESPLGSASFTISGAADENENVTSQAIPVDDTSNTYTPASGLTIPESATTAGTRVVFTARDTAGNSNPGAEVFIKVDATKPEIGDINVTGYNGSTPIVGYPAISATVSDNLTIQTAVMTITYPNGSTKQVSLSAKEKTGLSELLSHQIEIGAPDGEYKVTVTAQDMAGNPADIKEITFSIDNTFPVVTARISSGTVGGKATREDGTDMYYRSDVGVEFTCYDDNIKSITVTDNGTPIDVSWENAVGQVTISAEGRHVIKINASDVSDNNAEEKQVEFIIDKSAPGISLVLNGLPYSEAYGVVDCMADSTVAVSVSDMTVDAGDFHYQVVQTKPDQATTVSQYLTTDARSFTFGEEADYTMNFYAVDMANNQSATRSVSFRVDKTAPELNISGAVSGGTSANAATVSFSMKEAFWRDASGVITIYRKAGDGKEESVYKTVNVTPTAYETVVTETLSETGVYRMEFKAADRVGHSVSKEQIFTIDREAPVITLTGVNNYDVTDKTVELRAEIADDFYSSKTVSVEGTRTDINGKVTKLSFSSFNQHGNPTVIGESFEQDGIYDITITSKDAAGNSHTSTVHFTVDKTAPKITGLEDLDGAILNTFDFDFDLDEMVSDLTVCDVHMYLNGSEYDGVSEVEDGSYTLLITAEDELGHYSEMSISFVLDTKAPVFIVTGVEDGEVKQEAYSIDVSLQLEEDTLTSVTLNGEVVVVSNNTAHIDVTTEGDYTLYMKAVDEAGNESEQTIEFRFGQESHIILWICIIVAVIILAGIIIFIILRKKKKEKE